ncbi:MAG: IreB family regulatory phosphoprotein [Clostridiales bacterium]|nr:IreB family regulatory phosphoprotein [Clostridiales bacterium]
MENNNTMMFSVDNEKEQKVESVLLPVYSALKEKGYNPINQIVGYLISGDPAYVTNYKNARNLISKLEREEILEDVLGFYIKNNSL